MCPSPAEAPCCFTECLHEGRKGQEESDATLFCLENKINQPQPSYGAGEEMMFTFCSCPFFLYLIHSCDFIWVAYLFIYLFDGYIFQISLFRIFTADDWRLKLRKRNVLCFDFLGHQANIGNNYISVVWEQNIMSATQQGENVGI